MENSKQEVGHTQELLEALKGMVDMVEENGLCLDGSFVYERANAVIAKAAEAAPAQVLTACAAHNKLADTIHELSTQLQSLRTFCAEKNLRLTNELVNSTAAALAMAKEALAAVEG